MKYVIKGVIYNLSCIILFFFIYIYLKDELTLDPSYSRHIPPNKIDLFFLATTVQSGVGYSILYPLTHLTKSVMIIQQLLMITSNLMLLYLFTLYK